MNMNVADQYAKALHDIVAEDPSNGTHYLKNLRAVLKKRHHEQLLPHILCSYEQIESNKKRQARLGKITPELRRTRMLVELYRKLVA